MVSKHAFVLVDVFTDVPLAGNQLAVFPDADDLDEARMQAIAREFNYSETTFVVRPRDPRATRRLRSFSPTAEVFGAGHNALGAWWAIVSREHMAKAGTAVSLWQELGDSVLPVEASFDCGGLNRVSMAHEAPRIFDGAPDHQALARALSLDVDALRVSDLAPQIISTGATHLLVPVRSLADLARVSVNAEQLVTVAKPLGCEGCYLFTHETADEGSAAHARGFFPGIGIAEDPATGTAAGPLGAYLVARNLAHADEWLTIEQGDEMRRPSRIDVRVSGERVDVGGRCTIVGEGALFV